MVMSNQCGVSSQELAGSNVSEPGAATPDPARLLTIEEIIAKSLNDRP